MIAVVWMHVVVNIASHPNTQHPASNEPWLPENVESETINSFLKKHRGRAYMQQCTVRNAQQTFSLNKTPRKKEEQNTFSSQNPV